MSNRKAQVSEAVPMDWSDDGKAHVDYLVQPECEGTFGHHVCITHPKADTHNNFMAGSHFLSPGKHVEVWLCPTHGPEAAHT